MEKALAKINAQIQTLQRRADASHKSQGVGATEKPAPNARVSDLAGRYPNRLCTRARARGRPDSRSVVAPKYRNPESGETWSGRGRAPRWLTSAEKAGRNRDDFRV